MWNQIPPIQSLKLFDTVVRHRSMTKAAAECGVSQSAVSQSVRQLEEFLQSPLLDRTTRPMTLTKSGEEFHRVCLETLGRLSHVVTDMRAAGAGNSNAVTVSCNLGFATYWLMPRLNYFSADHPDCEVHVMVAYQGAAGLHDGSDVSIRFGTGKWADGPWRPLLGESLIPVCSPGYLEAQGPVQDLDALAARRLINVSVTDPGWLGWDQYFGFAGHQRAMEPRGLRFGNYVQAMQAAQAGEGIMLGWRSVAGDLLNAQQLTIALDEPVHLSSGYFVRVNERCGKSGLFLDWLAGQAEATRAF